MSQKNGKKSSRRKYHNVTSLKIDVLEKYYYIRKKGFDKKTTAIIIEKVQKYQKPVTESLSVSLN